MTSAMCCSSFHRQVRAERSVVRGLLCCVVSVCNRRLRLGHNLPPLREVFLFDELSSLYTIRRTKQIPPPRAPSRAYAQASPLARTGRFVIAIMPNLPCETQACPQNGHIGVHVTRGIDRPRVDSRIVLILAPMSRAESISIIESAL